MPDIPNIEEKTKAELEEIIRVIMASSLPETVKSFIIKCIESALWFPHILQKKNISLGRLREMIFGTNSYGKQNKHNKNNDNSNNTPPLARGTGIISTQQGGTPNDELITTQAIENAVNALAKPEENLEDKKKIPGHGRMPHTFYEDFKQIIY